MGMSSSGYCVSALPDETNEADCRDLSIRSSLSDCFETWRYVELLGGLVRTQGVQKVVLLRSAQLGLQALANLCWVDGLASKRS